MGFGVCLFLGVHLFVRLLVDTHKHGETDRHTHTHTHTHTDTFPLSNPHAAAINHLNLDSALNWACCKMNLWWDEEKVRV